MTKRTGHAKKLADVPGVFMNKSRFTDNFIKVNGLGDKFKEWVLYPGMPFNSEDKWWGNLSKRDSLHEGLDLCFYKDKDEIIYTIEEDMKIPAMYDGVVVEIINDFIGQTVIIKHDMPDEFIAFYAHTTPEDYISIGKTVKEGELIASVAGLKESKSGLSPHLHLSIGTPRLTDIEYDKLDWSSISEDINFVDPLQGIDRYSLM